MKITCQTCGQKQHPNGVNYVADLVRGIAVRVCERCRTPLK